MGFRKSLRSGLASIFKPKKQVTDGSVSEQNQANTSQTITEHEIPLQSETMHPEVTANQPRGHLTDADPVANAMFNGVGKVVIYGGGFVQNNAAKSNRHGPGFELLRKQVASAAFHNSAQRIDPARCHPETRVDVMQTIYDWITKSGHRNEWLLWLNGAAGAGKSAIMQSVAERCVLAAIAIASFFFVRADSSRNTMAPFIATLIYQLIQEIPETSDDILSIIERNPLIFEQSLESQLQKLIIQPLLRLPTHLQRLFVVFVDGLDECNDWAHQSNLIKLLGSISSGRNTSIIFVIASRREPQIEAEFCQKNVVDILTTIPLDSIQASDDIRRYLNARFEEIKATHLRRQFLSPDWPSSAVIEQIVGKSSGQFIYASVVIGYISLPRGHPAVQLDIINGLRPRNPAENPFAQLDALYKYIFSQVKRLDIVQNILAFHLACVKISDRPSGGAFDIESIEAMFQLVAGELEVLFADLTAVIDCSGVREDRGIKFLHASLPDFLQDKSRSGDYYIDLDEYQTNLLCTFLERPCSMSDPHSSAHNSNNISDLEFQERRRLGAIDTLLERAKPSDHLQSACMNFNCIIYSAAMLESYWEEIMRILDCLKNLKFEDQGHTYHHVLDVFAAGFAQYWSSHNGNHINDRTTREISNQSPDLLARIDQILQKE